MILRNYYIFSGLSRDKGQPAPATTSITPFPFLRQNYAILGKKSSSAFTDQS